MAFPRSFKSQTWFVRLPNGGIEVVTAGALERSFRCGLVDARTPVCAFGTHVWTTLGDAASLEDPEGSSSLLPVALDDSVPPLDGASWRVGNYVDERSLKSGLGRSVTTLLVAAGIAAFSVVGVKYGMRSAHASKAFAGAGAVEMVAALPPPSATALPPPTPTAPPKPEPTVMAIHEPNAQPSTPPARLTKDQKRRLQEMDFERRFGRPGEKPRRRSHQTSRTSAEPPSTTMPTPDPFTRGVDRYDPLNGAL